MAVYKNIESFSKNGFQLNYKTDATNGNYHRLVIKFTF